jgi:hypothetical protein
MPVAIPRQRPDALARLDAERREGIGHAAGALRKIPIAVTVNVSFDTPRNDFLIAVMAIGVYE